MNDSRNAVEKIRPKATHGGRLGTGRTTEASTAAGAATAAGGTAVAGGTTVAGAATATPVRSSGNRLVDLTGKRFSHLTVIERVPGKNGYKGYAVWRCKCDCGRYAEYESRALKIGRAEDCGEDDCPYHVEAIQKRYRFEDLTGQRFGKLVVTGPVMAQVPEDNKRDPEKKSSPALKTQMDTQYSAEYRIDLPSEPPSELLEPSSEPPSEPLESSTVVDAAEKSRFYNPKSIKRDKHGRALWNCICDCGNTVVTSKSQLRAGYRKSCGCLFQPPRKDWVGKRFGMLTVTAYGGKREGKHWWKCKCDCGNEATVSQSCLQNGHTTSCGCQAKFPHEYRTLVDGTCVEVVRAAVERRTVFRSNTSGVRGVYWNKRNFKWTAQITFKGKTHYLGSYDTIREAEEARKRGEDRYFGEFLEDYDGKENGTV